MNDIIPYEVESSSPLPDIIQGYVSVLSRGKKSQLKASVKEVANAASAYRSTEANRKQVRKALESIGFEICAESRLGMAVAGPPGAFEELTGGKLVTFERLMHAEAGHERYVTHIDLVGANQPASRCVGHVKSTTTKIEGVLIERPRILQGIFPTPIPPSVDRFHLRVPDDVALGLNAIAAHRDGHTGSGVIVAMVDSGQYAHPFFAGHKYQVRPTISVVPGASPSKDPVGHGTGESANIFAVAPSAELQAVRASNNQGALVGAIAGFLRAKQGNPAILTNSWGGDGPYPPPGPPDTFEIMWALEIVDAIDQGIFVVFSAGNGSFTIEPQVPGVFAAGGVYMQQNLGLRASNYTSGYPSPWFNGVNVPDASGLVGLLPRAKYIMLPIPPGSEIDRSLSQPDGQTDPDTDGTGGNDGWALFSGTSAAAPQIAGAAAVLLSAKPGLTPAQVTEALKVTAVDVRTGRCHPRFNNRARIGRDDATGHGLVDVSAAVAYALANF